MRKLLLCIVVVLAVAGCSSRESFGDPITEGEPTPIPTAVVASQQTFEVTRGDIVDQRTFSGRVAPVVSQDLQFGRDGRVVEVFFERDSVVSAGDLIAQLDTSVLERELTQAESELSAARSLLTSAQNQVDVAQRRAEIQLQLAQLELDFAQSQAGDSPTAEQTFDIQRKTLERDLAQLAVDEANNIIDPDLEVAVALGEQLVADIQAEIEKTRLVAPMDGTIQRLSVRVGDLVTGFEPVGLVVDESNLEVQDELREEVLDILSEGMPVSLQRSNTPGDDFPGMITILPAPFGTGQDEFAHITFENPEDSANFSIGDRISISVVVAERDGAVILSEAALRDFNGRKFVVVQDESIQQRVDVRLGIEGDGMVEIVEGLEPGQVVIGQ